MSRFGLDVDQLSYREALDAREFCLQNIDAIKRSKDKMLASGEPDNDWYSRTKFKMDMYTNLIKRLNRYIKYREKLMAEEKVRLNSRFAYV